MRLRHLALALVLLDCTLSSAWSNDISTTNFQCTSQPCANTVTGEDPQDVLLRKARAEQNKVKTEGPDEARWHIPIYSTSTARPELEMTIVKSAKFSMRLAPAQGYLNLSTPATNHVFKIAEQNAIDNLCPKYNVSIVDASKTHAVIQKSCPRIQYKPGKFFSSVTYYLYDVPTATMRDIWQASAPGSKDPLPLANPVPVMKVTADGYFFDWEGLHSGGSPASPSVVRNKYVRKTENNTPVLICIDMAVQGGATEDEMCEGGTLPRVN